MDINAKANAKAYPSAIQEKVQTAEEVLAQLMNNFFALFPRLGDMWQAKILSTFSMLVLPNKDLRQKPIVCPVIDALHFRRGIQTMPNPNP